MEQNQSVVLEDDDQELVFEVRRQTRGLHMWNS